MKGRAMQGGLGALLAGCLAAAPAAPAADAAPGWLVRELPTPGVVQGDVVATAAGTVLVGQGGFGPGAQHVVRMDASGTTVIAEGFGSLGGFALAGDGTLYVVDNCFTGDFGCDGATTGDTVYAIPDALGRADAIAAADAELLPSGSIPAAFDVLVAQGLGLLVSEAVGPGAGRVLRVADGGATTLLAGFDFTAGLATQGDRLLVGNSDASFVGSVRVFENGAEPGSELVNGLSGAFGVAASPTDVFVTGGFTADFSSSTVVAVGEDGSPRDIANGFSFTGGLDWEPARRQVYVLDFDARAVAVLCEDEDSDGACDAACPAPVPARTRAEIALTADGTPPVMTLAARLRLGRGDRPDPGAAGLAIGVTDAGGTVLADWRVPAGAGWQRRGRRWTWRGSAEDAVSEVRMRRRNRRLEIQVTGRIGRVPAGAFESTIALTAEGGACGRGDFDGLVAASR